MPLPRWVEPQLSKLVERAPTGPHEIKFDGYRMAARIDSGKVQLLTRSGLDWTAKYPATTAAFAKLPVKTAYIDGELCGVRGDGVTSFELMQQASDAGYGGLVYFAFDLIELDGEDVARLPLLERKERLAQLLKEPPAGIVYSEHDGGDGEAFRRAACQHGLEGVVSKRIDRPYLPGDRGAWVKSKCLNRARDQLDQTPRLKMGPRHLRQIQPQPHAKEARVDETLGRWEPVGRIGDAPADCDRERRCRRGSRPRELAVLLLRERSSRASRVLAAGRLSELDDTSGVDLIWSLE
jgi:hypothetical protein